VDAVLFTSSSTAENFCALFDGHGTATEWLPDVVVASIGPITSATCVRLGIRVDVEASPYTLPALLDALETHFESREKSRHEQ
jgi:uroporphyrinogen III methyltransferase/synthase